MPMGLQVLHRLAQGAALTFLLPSNAILPTLTVGPSLMWKLTDTEAGGIVLTSAWIDGELVTVLGEQLLQDGDGAGDPGRVVLALDRESRPSPS